jgi:hypothetical protein
MAGFFPTHFPSATVFATALKNLFYVRTAGWHRGAGKSAGGYS